MNVMQLHLPLLFVVVFASEDAALSRVCYEGQQPGRNYDGEEYRWYLTANPTDCTAIQVGGLNTRRHLIRPLECVATEEAEESFSAEMTSDNNISSCAVTTTSSQPVSYPTHGRFSQPLERLEFTVLYSGYLPLYVSLINNDGYLIYAVGLGRHTSTIYSYESIENLRTAEGVEFPGRFWLTYNSGEIQVGKDGNDTALMHYQDDSFCGDLWSIKLESTGPAEWLIYLPYEEQASCPRSE